MNWSNVERQWCISFLDLLSGRGLSLSMCDLKDKRHGCSVWIGYKKRKVNLLGCSLLEQFKHALLRVFDPCLFSSQSLLWRISLTLISAQQWERQGNELIENNCFFLFIILNLFSCFFSFHYMLIAQHFYSLFSFYLILYIFTCFFLSFWLSAVSLIFLLPKIFFFLHFLSWYIFFSQLFFSVTFFFFK